MLEAADKKKKTTQKETVQQKTLQNKQDPLEIIARVEASTNKLQSRLQSLHDRYTNLSSRSEEQDGRIKEQNQLIGSVTLIIALTVVGLLMDVLSYKKQDPVIIIQSDNSIIRHEDTNQTASTTNSEPNPPQIEPPVQNGPYKPIDPRLFNIH